MAAAIAEAQLAGDETEIDLSGYATKTYVDEAIAQAEIGGSGDIDLSSYATKSYVDSAVSNVSVDLSNYYTKAQVAAYVATQRLEIEQWVNHKFAEIDTSEGVEY